MYERKTAQNKASVIRRLVNLKYKDGRSVTEHLNDFQVKDSMFNEEARRKEQGVVAKSEALVSEYRREELTIENSTGETSQRAGQEMAREESPRQERT
ncbi:hypothetical protein L3X38_001183 [Prunus dulcis]|uniref:Uncharacterized protein n=1 Tax=Prunus dulcis TaxID=3755 RepID=A0AAD4WS74_PRUDU|nr:hypothetical protein L3X38_001183 [Prunus dulcis]